MLTNDKEIILGVFQPGDYFGEMSLLDEKPRSATARTVTECILLALSKENFDKLLDNHPALSRKLTRAITNRLRNTAPVKTRAIPQEPGELVPLEGPDVRVFISYSRKDKDFVQQLHDAIRKQGMEAWVDSENIPLTVDWWEEIQRGIEEADAFAFVISPDSVNSRVCNDEVQAAVESHKRLIPVLYKNPDHEDPIHPAVAATNWVFIRTEQEMNTHIPEMVRIIRTDLDWVQNHTRLLVRAGEWADARRDSSFLLREADLSKAEEWLAKADKVGDPKPSPLHQDYIFASRQDRNRRRGLMIAGGAIAFVILSLLVLTLIGFQNAITNENEANIQLNIASTARADAENQKIEADNQRVIDETQSANAENQRATAQAESELRATAQADAFSQRDLALSRQRAAQAIEFLSIQPDLAALLSIEALKTSDTLEAQNSLLTVLQQGLTREIVPITPDIPIQLSGIYSVAISPDGNRLAFSQQNGTIMIWSIQNGTIERSFRGHDRKRIWSLAFSPDGKTLASGGDDSAVYIWDVETGSQISRFSTSNLVLSVAWNPDGTQVASSAGPRVIVWDLNTEERREANLVFALNQIAWSPDGTKIAAANRDTVLYVLESERLNTIQTLRGHIGDVQSVAWAPDSNLLASGGIDSRILFWDIGKGEQVAELDGHEGIVFSLAFNYDGKILASGSEDSQVFLWNVDTKSFLTTVKTFNRDVRGVAFSPGAGKTFLAAGSQDKSVSLFEIHIEQPLSEELASELGKVSGLAINIDSDFTAFSLRENTQLDLWAINTQALTEANSIKRVTVGNAVESLALSANTELTLIGYQNGRIGLTYNPTSEIRNFSQPDPATALAIRPDNLQFASGHCRSYQLETLTPECEEAEILFWDLESGVTIQTLTGITSKITVLAYSTDGTILASGDENRTILLWDYATGEKIGIPLSRHQNAITSLAFSSDGTLLASGSADNTIILWDLSSAQPIGDPIGGSSGGVTALVFQLDGKVLFLGNGDGSIYRWEIDPALWESLACELAGRNLSLDEWSLFFIDEEYQGTCTQYPLGE